MTSHVTSAGSPLDDYLRDEGESVCSDSRRRSLEDYPHSGDEGDETLVSPDTSPKSPYSSNLPSTSKGWTGNVNAVPGPSKLSPALPGHYSGDTAHHRLRDGPDPIADVHFAERFKYIICSSGILEKDYVPGLGGANKDVSLSEFPVDLEPPLNGKADLHALDTPHLIPATGDIAAHGNGIGVPWRNLEQSMRSGWGQYPEMRKLLKQKWDILLAGTILILACWWILRTGLMVTLIVSILGLWSTGTLLMSTAPPNISDSDIGVQSALRTDALAQLDKLLSSSRRLDSCLESALALLHDSGDDMDDSEHTHHDLRVALDRMSTNLCDHLTASTGRLLTMASHDQLEILADMYDVPLSDSLSGRRQSPPSDSSDGEWEYEDKVELRGVVPSPARRNQPQLLRLGLSPQKSNKGFPSAFTPSKEPRGHLRQLSLVSSASATLPRYGFSHPNTPLNWTPRDRFTSLPPRTPRSSRRISLDPHMWQRIQSEAQAFDQEETGGSDDGSLTDPDAVDLDPRKIDRDSADQGNGKGTTDTDINDDRASSNLANDDDTLKTHPSPHSPFRRSPLANGSFSPPMGFPSRLSSIFPRTVSARAPRSAEPTAPCTWSSDPSPTKGSGSKRRSLQSMPYISSSDSSGQRSPTKHIARLRSRPTSAHSDLQSHGRSFASKGRLSAPRSRASSVTSRERHTINTKSGEEGHVGLGLPSHFVDPAGRPQNILHGLLKPPRPTRKETLDPLTLPSLKASCLAVHLKRRKMACCLLGLRFAEPGADYWSNLCEIMQEMCDVIEREVDQLQEMVSAQEPSLKRTLTEGANGHRISRQRYPSDMDGFAPRQHPADTLLERVDVMQTTLAELWGQVEDLKSRIESGDEVDGPWKRLREKLGVMVREWERGRDSVSRLSTTDGPIDVPVISGNEQLHNGDTSDAVQVAEDLSEDALPEFIKTWSTESESTRIGSIGSHESLERSDTQALEDITATNDLPLPLPGIDEVFESDLTNAAFTRLKSTLTREERIRLAKEARGKGLDPLTGRGQDLRDGVVDESLQLRAQNGDVVNELKGMIGLIRKMKGLDEGVTALSPSEESPPKSNEYSHVTLNGSRLEQEQEQDHSGGNSPPVGDEFRDTPSRSASLQLSPLGQPLPPAESSRDAEDHDHSPSSPRKSPPSPPPQLTNVLFPSDDIRRSFVFPALDRQTAE